MERLNVHFTTHSWQRTGKEEREEVEEEAWQPQQLRYTFDMPLTAFWAFPEFLIICVMCDVNNLTIDYVQKSIISINLHCVPKNSHNPAAAVGYWRLYFGTCSFYGKTIHTILWSYTFHQQSLNILKQKYVFCAQCFFYITCTVEWVDIATQYPNKG